jgi:hypothetical protein
MTTSAAWLAAAVRSGALQSHLPHLTHLPDRDRLWGDRGEGVISAAIAVLIMAFLGALMWVGFQKIWTDTEKNTNTQIQNIGK